MVTYGPTCVFAFFHSRHSTDVFVVPLKRKKASDLVKLL